MTRALRILAALSAGLGFVLALPGLLFLLGSSQIASLVVDLEQADRDAALYPPDLAPESEPR